MRNKPYHRLLLLKYITYSVNKKGRRRTKFINVQRLPFYYKHTFRTAGGVQFLNFLLLPCCADIQLYSWFPIPCITGIPHRCPPSIPHAGFPAFAVQTPGPSPAFSASCNPLKQGKQRCPAEESPGCFLSP